MIRGLIGVAALAVCVAAGWISPDALVCYADEREASQEADAAIVIPEHAHVTILEDHAGEWYLSASAYLSKVGTA